MQQRCPAQLSALFRAGGENPNLIDNEHLLEEINDGIASNKWVISCLKSDAWRNVLGETGQSGSDGKNMHRCGRREEL